MKRIILLLVAISLLLSSCKLDMGPAFYVVDFNTDGAEKIQSVNAEPGTKIEEPAEPVKEGYTFVGWYFEGEKWDFDNAVNRDMTLIAMWEKTEENNPDDNTNETTHAKYTVTFVTNGGTGEFQSQEVIEGDTVKLPTLTPKKEGYRFLGWFYDGAAWNFGTPVTRNITLYAKWEEIATETPITCTVTFDTQGGNAIPTQMVVFGETVTKPANPARFGYVFTGWYYGDELWSFESYTVTEDIVLVAKWSVASDADPHYHIDANTDGKCDVCGYPTSTECLIHTDLNGDGTCDACGKGTSIDCTKHIDKNKDYVCDKCKESIPKPTPPTPAVPAELIFRMSMNSNGDSLSSGCMRYLAGEDDKFYRTIDDDVLERNTDAYYKTNVNVTYLYYEDNNSKYGWGKAVNEMLGEILTNSRDAADMYCNFQYDLIGLYLKGGCANLTSTTRGENHFEFLDEDYNEWEDSRGYMYSYMSSLTLDQSRMYILASDYFIDIVRSFLVVPVNVRLLESVGMDITGDIDDKAGFTIDDFYTQVKNREWTYRLLAAYSSAIYEKGNQNFGNDANLHDTLGFAVSSSGLPSAAFLYTTSINVLDMVFDPDTGDYTVSYPMMNEELYDLASALKTLFSSTGVVCVKSNYQDYGTTAANAIRTRFCENKILFGSTVMVGSLEHNDYQRLKHYSGFGIVPVPLYHEIEEGSEETYLTAVHNVSRPGVISAATTEFSACTAFLNYQSTHSSDILNEYYDYMLQYDIADGSRGNVEMFQYIRRNVRSPLDKFVEDATGLLHGSSSYSLHIIFSNAQYKVEDMRDTYCDAIEQKSALLSRLYNEFSCLPN